MRRRSRGSGRAAPYRATGFRIKLAGSQILSRIFDQQDRPYQVGIHAAKLVEAIATYRPVEILGTKHPLGTTKEELELHQYCVELRVPLLSEADVAAYLGQRFAIGKESATLRREAIRERES